MFSANGSLADPIVHSGLLWCAVADAAWPGVEMIFGLVDGSGFR
jgi:hypothetical protein